MRLSKLLIGILLFIGSATYAQHSPQDTLTSNKKRIWKTYENKSL